MNTDNLFQFFPKHVARAALHLHTTYPQTAEVLGRVRETHSAEDDATGWLMNCESAEVNALVDAAFDCEAAEMDCDVEEVEGDMAFDILAAWVQIVVDKVDC